MVVRLPVACWGWTVYRHKHDVSDVIAGRSTLARPDHYADESQAVQALNSLDEDDRKRIVVDQSDLIQNFLLSRIDAYWNPDKDRYEYAKAEQVFKLRDDLKLYSPTLDIKRSAVDKQEEDDLLNNTSIPSSASRSRPARSSRTSRTMWSRRWPTSVRSIRAVRC